MAERLFVDQPPEDESWTQIHIIADAAYYPIRRFWLETFLDLKARTAEIDLVQTLLRGGEIEIAQLTARIWGEMEPGMARRLAEILTVPVERAALVSTASTETVIRQVFPDARIRVVIGPVNPTTLSWISQYVGQQIVEIGETTRAAIRTVVHDGFVRVETVDQIARNIREHIGLTTRQTKALERVRQVLVEDGISPRRIDERIASKGRRMLRDRARLISRTESITATSAGAHLNWVSAEQQGLWDPRFRRHWIVARDERTCFCAGTMVDIPEGRKAIEYLRPGDYVITPEGKRKLLATVVRPYAGPMVIIHTINDALVCLTEDHPVYVNGDWAEASTIRPGDFLQSIDQEPLQVRNIAQFCLQDMEDYPTSLDQECIAAGIFPLVSMPIDPVNFNGDAYIKQSEVNAISSYLEFLNEFHSEKSQCLTHDFLWESLALKGSIAPKRAKLPICISRTFSFFLPAMPTNNIVRWSPTNFRTIDTTRTSLSSELFTTTRACEIDSFTCATNTRANFITVCDGRTDRKNCFTDRAYFRCSGRSNGIQVAAPRTEISSINFCHSVGKPKNFPALLTCKILRLSSCQSRTFIGTERIFSSQSISSSEFVSAVCAVVGERHKSYISRIVKKYSNNYSIPVYDIEVEKEHVFYTSGFLVHNCPICSGIPVLNPNGVGLHEPFRTSIGPILHPTAHPACRCSIAIRATELSEGA